MNRSLTTIVAFGVISSCLTLVGCNWSSGGDSSFNTSRTNLQVNISGVYDGQNNGKAVSNPTAGNITTLIVQQSGNVLEVTDNQGSSYRGSVGVPTNLASVDDNGNDVNIPLGSELASYQVGFEGTDNVSAQKIRFTGAITLVAVERINGTATTSANRTDTTSSQVDTTVNTGTSSSTSTDTTNNTTNNDTTNSDNTTVDTDVVNQTGQGGTQVGNNGQMETDLTSTTVNTTRQTTTGTDNSTSSTSTSNNTTQNQNTSTTTTTGTSGNGSRDTNATADSARFILSENNTQMRLRGSWIEDNGRVSSVEALSPGAGGIFAIPIAQGQDREDAGSRDGAITSNDLDLNPEAGGSTIPGQ